MGVRADWTKSDSSISPLRWGDELVVARRGDEAEKCFIEDEGNRREVLQLKEQPARRSIKLVISGSSCCNLIQWG